MGKGLVGIIFSDIVIMIVEVKMHLDRLKNQ